MDPQAFAVDIGDKLLWGTLDYSCRPIVGAQVVQDLSHHFAVHLIVELESRNYRYSIAYGSDKLPLEAS